MAIGTLWFYMVTTIDALTSLPDSFQATALAKITNCSANSPWLNSIDYKTKVNHIKSESSMQVMTTSCAAARAQQHQHRHPKKKNQTLRYEVFRAAFNYTRSGYKIKQKLLVELRQSSNQYLIERVWFSCYRVCHIIISWGRENKSVFDWYSFGTFLPKIITIG